MKLLLATRNPGKLREFARILATQGLSGLQPVGLADLPAFAEAPETGASFEENALAKARDAVAATGLASVADDSGLTVDALNGMPGVLSARWAGGAKDDAANLALLLDQLTDVPDERLGAAFVCAAALITPTGDEVVLRREWRGTITRKPRGTNGFGYDPIFVPAGHDVTSAELASEDKDAISHRGQALRALADHLRELLD